MPERSLLPELTATQAVFLGILRSERTQRLTRPELRWRAGMTAKGYRLTEGRMIKAQCIELERDDDKRILVRITWRGLRAVEEHHANATDPR